LALGVSRVSKVRRVSKVKKVKKAKKAKEAKKEKMVFPLVLRPNQLPMVIRSLSLTKAETMSSN
jgi:hypothetical protein